MYKILEKERVNQLLAGEEIKYDFGCGKHKLSEEHIGVDIRELPGVAILCDREGWTKFASSSAHEIHSCHFIAHLPLEELWEIMDTWYRMLCKGGELIIFFPDISSIKRGVDDNYALDYIFGEGGPPEMEHKSFWSFDLMLLLLTQYDFVTREGIKYTGVNHFAVGDRAWTSGVRCIK